MKFGTSIFKILNISISLTGTIQEPQSMVPDRSIVLGIIREHRLTVEWINHTEYKGAFQKS